MQKIEVIARTVILHENKILLDYVPKKNFYYLPGGHVEFGETSEQTLKRELTEELGAEISVGKCITTQENFFDDADGPHHEILRLYEATLLTDPSSLSDKEEKIHHKWISVDKIKDVRILPEKMKKFLGKQVLGL